MKLMKPFLIQIIVSGVFVMTFYSGYAQTKSGVKSIKEISVDSRDKEEIKSFQSFDTHGNLIEEIDYDDDGKIKDHVKYEYNNEHLKTKEIQSFRFQRSLSIIFYNSYML